EKSRSHKRKARNANFNPEQPMTDNDQELAEHITNESASQSQRETSAPAVTSFAGLLQQAPKIDTGAESGADVLDDDTDNESSTGSLSVSSASREQTTSTDDAAPGAIELFSIESEKLL